MSNLAACRELGWEAATERMLDAGSIAANEWPGPISTAQEAMAWSLYNSVTGVQSMCRRDVLCPAWSCDILLMWSSVCGMSAAFPAVCWLFASALEHRGAMRKRANADKISDLQELSR